MNAIKELEREQLRTDVPEIAPGDTVRVSVKVVEGNRERIQVFEGTVMRMRGGGLNKAITVRRIASGVGVERTFMVHAPRDRQDRGRPPRRRPPRPALLPPRPGRQVRHPPRAPRQLTRLPPRRRHRLAA